MRPARWPARIRIGFARGARSHEWITENQIVATEVDCVTLETLRRHTASTRST